VAILYGLFYGIQFGVFFDFHPIIIGVGLLSWLAYALEYKKKILFFFLFVLCLLTQENMGLSLACLGFIYLFRKEYRGTAVIMIIVGILYTIAGVKIVAGLSPVGYEYKAEIPFHIQTIVTRLFDSEEKRLTWLYSYSWFSFLPLFSPGSVLAVVTDLSQYFVTGEAYSRMWSPFMHHRAILSVFLTLGLIDVLVFFKRKKIPVSLVAVFLVLVAAILQYHFHFALNKLVKYEYWKYEPWMENTKTLLKLVPPHASVAAQQNLVPHLSHRSKIYLVYPRMHDIPTMPCGEVSCWWLDFPKEAEYLVVDTRPNQWLTQILESNENWLSAISNMEKVGKIQLEKEIGDAKLFKINN
jgi:uncharacterized membrane protein